MEKIIKKISANWHLAILFIFISTYIFVFSWLSILRHNAFASFGDLANMDQTVWNTVNGRFFSFINKGQYVSRFSVHSDIILALISPMYLIWSNVRLLVALESFFLGLGALPVFLISQKILKNKFVSLAVSLAYLLNPGMQWTDIFDFHAVSLAIPFLLFAFYFMLEKKWKQYFFFILLAIMTKEQISLYVSVFGLYIFFFKNRKVGLITFFLGVVWFLTMVFVVIPHFSQDKTHWAMKWYVENSIENQRLEAGKLLVDKINLLKNDKFAKEYPLLLLKPFGFLPVFAFPWLIFSLPEFLINLFGGIALMRTIMYHYDSGITPSLVLSTIFAIKYLSVFSQKFFPKIGKFAPFFLSFWLIFSATRVNYHYSPLPTSPSVWKFYYKPQKEDIEFEKILQKLPKKVSISASAEVRPHISQREWVYEVPYGLGKADFVALIDENRQVGDHNPKILEAKIIKELNKNKNYKLIKKIGHFYLFEKLK